MHATSDGDCSSDEDDDDEEEEDEDVVVMAAPIGANECTGSDVAASADVASLPPLHTNVCAGAGDERNAGEALAARGGDPKRGDAVALPTPPAAGSDVSDDVCDDGCDTVDDLVHDDDDSVLSGDAAMGDNGVP